MTAAFAEWQPRYAEKHIATFPVNDNKKPGIRGWNRIGFNGSAELAEKFL
jgi:hypothetical protein